MKNDQIAVFVEERKWDYRSMSSIFYLWFIVYFGAPRRLPFILNLFFPLCFITCHPNQFTTHLAHFVAFGFTAALLEGLPIIGIVFEVSNRIGAAMWAYGMFRLFFVWLYLLLRS